MNTKDAIELFFIMLVSEGRRVSIFVFLLYEGDLLVILDICNLYMWSCLLRGSILGDQSDVCWCLASFTCARHSLEWSSSLLLFVSYLMDGAMLSGVTLRSWRTWEPHFVLTKLLLRQAVDSECRMEDNFLAVLLGNVYVTSFVWSA